jgi:FkbM family methyltransferase
VNRITLLKALERPASLLRRAGLGAAVDRARRVVAPRLGRFTVDVRGVRLSGDTQAHSHYVRELLEDDRERHVAELFEQSVPHGGLVLDVGAHLGYFSLLAARRGAKVIAFEPNPETLGFLRDNLRANGVEDRVTVVTKALAGEPGRRTFFLSPAGDTSSLNRLAGTVAEVEVEVTTADAVVDGRSVDVIKMDVEGAELEALAGMEASIAAASAGLRLFVEWNPLALDAAGASAAALPASLRALGLEPQVIDERAGALRPLTGEAPPDGEPYVNLVCVRAAR